MTQRRVDLRTLAFMLAAALAGAAWAYSNLQQVGDTRSTAVLTPLVWAVFAVPFFSFWGWLAARPSERWSALAVSSAVYFFSIFSAARLEQLILGRDQAQATGHALYFTLVLILQLTMIAAVALQRSLSHPGGQRAAA